MNLGQPVFQETIFIVSGRDFLGKRAFCHATNRVKALKGKPGIEWVQALADISRSRYVAMKPVHRLQICQIVHN